MFQQQIWALLTAMMLASALVIGLTMGLSASFPQPAPPPAVALPQTGVIELLPHQDYVDWYLTSTTKAATPDAVYFGAYKMEPVDDQLYIGFGTARPAETGGSLLAVSNGSVITAVVELDEEGFIDMQAVNGTLYIPGPDPTYGDGWNLGNFYVQAPGQPITKHRNLPDVIHTWGSWFDVENDVLYAAVSSHLGDNATWTGEIFNSTNQSADWTRIGNYQDGLGHYRTYDVIGFDDKLYAVWNDVHRIAGSECGLTMSADGGLTWTRITTIAVHKLACRPRLHVWDDKVLALSYDQDSLLTIDVTGTLTSYPLTGYRVPAWSYNYLANDAAGYLYTIAEYGQIIRTKNLIDWELMAYTGLDLFTIAYWPYHDWLVLGERGNGRLWKIEDLTNAEPLIAQYIVLMVADGWGANHIAAAAGYSGSPPPYDAWPRYWISTHADGGSYDPELIWSDFNHALTGATDSAAAATALYTGEKTANGRVSVNSAGNERLRTLSERAQEMGKATGVVSSVYVSHATPGAWMAHNDSRLNGYAIADEGFWGDPNTTGTITDHIRYGGGHGPTQPQDVIIGSGHPGWQGSTFVNTAMRDKLAGESGQPDAFVFVERLAGSPDGGQRLLTAANLTSTTRLAGLFGGTGGNLDYRLADGSGHSPENPTLAEMTEAALTVLSRNPNGFVLLVEGGAIDWAGHSNNMDQMVGEMLGFNEAVEAVIAWVDDPDNGSGWDNTLVIVTGDHETGYLTAAPNQFPDVPLGPVNASTIALEKVIAGTNRRASWDDLNNNNVIDPGETVYWAWNSGGHSNILVPLYARGTGAGQIAAYTTSSDLVRGAFLDNTDVFRVIDNAFRTYRIFIPMCVRA
jgi:alkaline phosphatase